MIPAAPTSVSTATSATTTPNVYHGAGTTITLPSGGTWKWIFTSGSKAKGGTSSGGTNVASDESYYGHCLAIRTA